MRKVLINKLNIEWLNLDKFNNLYDFYLIKFKNMNDKGYVNVNLVDEIITKADILSIQHSYEQSVYLMTKKLADTSIILNIINEYKDNQALELSKVSPTDIPSHYFFQLLINASVNLECGSGSVANVSGMLLIFNNKTYIDEKNHKVVACKISVDKDDAIKAGMVSFTSTTLKDRMFTDKDKYKFDYMPKYKVNYETGILYNTLDKKSYGEDVYIQRCVLYGNVKPATNYYCYDENKILDSKTAYIYRVLKEVNEIFSGLLKLSMTSYDQELVFETGKAKFKKKYINDFRQFAKKINFVDLSGKPLLFESYKEVLELSIKRIMTADNKVIPYEISYSDPEKVSRRKCNIILVPDANKIKEGSEDPYKLYDFKGVPVQHLIFDSISSFGKKTKIDYKVDVVSKILRNCLYNLIIKQDIEKRQFRLFNMNELELTEDYEFYSLYQSIMVNNRKQYINYIKLTVKPDGKFSFDKISDISDDKEIMELLQPASNIVGLVKNSRGLVRIKKTSYDPHPNFDAVYKAIEDLCNTESYYKMVNEIRRKDFFEENCIGLKDLSLVTIDDKECYIPGVYKVVPKNGLSRASNIYQMEVIEGNNIVKDILPTIGVPFVNNDKATVKPFIFKYMDEIKLNLEKNK